MHIDKYVFINTKIHTFVLSSQCKHQEKMNITYNINYSYRKTFKNGKYFSHIFKEILTTKAASQFSKEEYAYHT